MLSVDWLQGLFLIEISLQGSAPITSLSETSSDQEESETEPNGSHDLMDSSKMEKLFMTGVLDELKIRFDFNPQVNLRSLCHIVML